MEYQVGADAAALVGRVDRQVDDFGRERVGAYQHAHSYGPPLGRGYVAVAAVDVVGHRFP